MMRLQPIKRQVETGYPTRAELDADSEALRRLPRRWQSNAAVLATLAGLGLLAAPELLAGAAGKVESPIVARVAPVFPPDAGRARLMGDVAVPRFLNEDEARAIVTDALVEAGITVTPDAQIIKKVPLSIRVEAKDGGESTRTVKMDLTLDGSDLKHQVAYEVVTRSDLNDWRAAGITLPYEQSPALALREGITQGVPAGTYAVFYDPATAPFSSEDLRTQVRHFIAWLKAQGVI